MEQIPYIVYESAEARAERTQKRLILALIVAVVCLFVCNAAWLWAWCQYDYVGTDSSLEITQDGRGLGNINFGTQGDITDGADSESADTDDGPQA